ncbi:HlyC/CorC family transporter [Candidatus Sumerlaeota bacterium]|nr:HlyC/CorC family transporter [Candidatus Sumerlaeota bacterium]
MTETLAPAVLILLAVMASLVVSFFFSGSETAVISVNQFRLRHRKEQGDPKAGRTLALLSQISPLLSTVLIGTNLGNVFAALLFKLFLDLVWPGLLYTEIVCLVVLTPMIVVFAEILPKALFRAKADAWIDWLRAPLRFSMLLFRPITGLLDGVVALFLMPFGGRADRHRGPRTRRDLIMMLHAPSRSEKDVSTSAKDSGSFQAEKSGEAAILGTHGVFRGKGSQSLAHQEESRRDAPADSATDLDAGNVRGDHAALIHEPDERRIIENIIGLEQKQAREIMRPLVELEAVDLNRTSVRAFLDQARRSGHSRFPVYRDRIVNLIGYIDVYDVIRSMEPDSSEGDIAAGSLSSQLDSFVQSAYFIPETKPIDDLLQEFLALRINNAIVVDEYGGCSGWVTREDMIEEIVGELQDELDRETMLISEQPDGSYLVDGRSDLDDIGEVMRVDLDEPDCDTLGGFLMRELGRIPKIGDEIALQEWRIRIIEMDGMRVSLVNLRRV